MPKSILRLLTAIVMAWVTVGPAVSTNNALLSKILSSGTPNVFAECTPTVGDCGIYSSYNNSLAEDPADVNHSTNYSFHLGPNGAESDITGPVDFAVTTNGECTSSPNTFTITTGNTIQALVITAIDDSIVEASQTCDLTFTAISGATGVTNSPFTDQITIDDNDTYLDEYPQSPIHTKTIIGSFDFFPFHVGFPSIADIDIHLKTSSFSDCTFALNSKNFPASSWFLDYSYTITAVDDGVADPGDNCAVEFEDLSQGHGIIKNVGYTILDNTGGPTPPTGSPIRVDYAGTQPNGGSYDPSLSQDGNYTSYTTSSNNIFYISNGRDNIAKYNKTTGISTLVSSSASGEEANANSSHSSISANGRYVVFQSYATNLVPGTLIPNQKIYLKDTLTGSIEDVSITYLGGETNGACVNPSMSADARYISFACSDDDIVNNDGNGYQDVFVRDRQLGITTLVSTDSTGLQANNGSGYRYTSISGDGTHVVFDSDADNMVIGDSNSLPDVFEKNTTNEVTVRVNVSTSGQEANLDSIGYGTYPRSVSSTGRYVVFSSQADNLVVGDVTSFFDIFLRDTQSNTTTLISKNTSDQFPNLSSGTQSYSISDDGTKILYDSIATDLIANDTNGTRDIFVYDTSSGLTQRVSQDNSNLLVAGESTRSNIARDGSFAGFDIGTLEGYSYIILASITYSGPACTAPGQYCGQFDLNQGLLITRFVLHNDYTTVAGQAATYHLNNFNAASAFNMYSDGSITTNGSTNPLASTSDQSVSGHFYLIIENASGRHFSTTLTITNFANGANIVPLCVDIACVTPKATLESQATVQTTSQNYPGQNTTGITELTTGTAPTDITDLTATGVSNSYNLVSFSDGYGRGEFHKPVQLNLTVPAYTPTGTYTSTMTVTSLVQ